MILLFPFLPFFMYGFFSNGMLSDVQSVDNVFAKENENREFSKIKFDQNFQTSNLFSTDEKSKSSFLPVRAEDYANIKIFAGASVVIDVDSGTILHYDDGRKKTQIASLTKMMTAVLAMENIKNLDEDILISRESLNVCGTTVGCPTSVFCNSNQMYAGEKISAKNVLKAMLLNSANDAATALGIHIAGSTENFVKMMNDKAKELGMKDTNFCTPSGLEIDGKEESCHSSAYDIARIAAYSLKYETIWDIMKIKEEQIFSSNGKTMHQLKNTDILLDEIPNCIGGKTGFTPMAGKSLLLAVDDPTKKHRVVAVILNDENRWEDMKKLTNWVFDNYEWR
jgi:serine-type D-Ala-D-Ala carboxypeptidase (penicillin-binding protein 5/6)